MVVSVLAPEVPVVVLLIIRTLHTSEAMALSPIPQRLLQTYVFSVSDVAKQWRGDT